MSSPEWPLSLLMLSLEGLQARAQEGGLDSDDERRALAPLICLASDMEDAMKRERELASRRWEEDAHE